MDGHRASCLRELHLRQDGPTQDAVRIPERLDDLEVIIALAYEQLYGFAGGLHCRRKIARLALELGRFERAIRHPRRLFCAWEGHAAHTRALAYVGCT